MAGDADGVHHLPGDGRLPDLPRAGQDLDELARLVGAFEDLVVDGTPVDLWLAAHSLTRLSGITQ